VVRCSIRIVGARSSVSIKEGIFHISLDREASLAGAHEEEGNGGRAAANLTFLLEGDALRPVKGLILSYVASRKRESGIGVDREKEWILENLWKDKRVQER